MRYTIGSYSGNATVEIVNKQACVEYKVLSGFANEESVRAAAGNSMRGTYSHYYSGYYHERKAAVIRLEDDIKEAKELLAKLEFSLKVTKKRKWVKVD